jgi:hypothetical protein
LQNYLLLLLWTAGSRGWGRTNAHKVLW